MSYFWTRRMWRSYYKWLHNEQMRGHYHKPGLWEALKELYKKLFTK